MECTINRVGDLYRDQLLDTGHYSRPDDLKRIAALNIKALRYPVLWEKYCPDEIQPIAWDYPERELAELQEAGVTPIVGLLHHGSGPRYTNLMDPAFATKFQNYAQKVAVRFPWVTYYTPVNEPLTTARFSGLYGFWYPHLKDPLSFATMLINELKGTVLAMQAIREINPDAKLIQTEDLAKVHSTGKLAYQADFENHRRFLTFDLLCGKVDSSHAMWHYFISIGVQESELVFFLQNPCPPDVLGLNYYVTSERFLDEQIENHPDLTPGSNGIHEYVDIEAYRADVADGPEVLLKEVWNRYGIPMAVTETHMGCSREEQMRWVKEIWDVSCKLVTEGIPLKAVTVWSIFGAFDWNSLLTRDARYYEPGVFDIRGSLRPTALAEMVSSLGRDGEYNHPLLNTKGWWHNRASQSQNNRGKPLLIVGKHGVLARAFSKVCEERGIYHICLSRQEVDITRPTEILSVISQFKPWGVVNSSGFAHVDDAESQPTACYSLNTIGAENLARACSMTAIPFLTFSSDQVFDGKKKSPYNELDPVSPINHYGASKAEAESLVLDACPTALVVRTSASFGPWDRHNFAHKIIHALEHDQELLVASDVIISPTYLPHLVHGALDLFIDGEKGIWHLSNCNGILSWSEFALRLARQSGYEGHSLISTSENDMQWQARRPLNSALDSSKAVILPTLDQAIHEYLSHLKILN